MGHQASKSARLAPKDLLTLQSKEIATLQAEINLFRKKGGHIYTTVTCLPARNRCEHYSSVCIFGISRSEHLVCSISCLATSRIHILELYIPCSPYKDFLIIIITNPHPALNMMHCTSLQVKRNNVYIRTYHTHAVAVPIIVLLAMTMTTTINRITTIIIAITIQQLLLMILVTGSIIMLHNALNNNHRCSRCNAV